MAIFSKKQQTDEETQTETVNEEVMAENQAQGSELTLTPVLLSSTKSRAAYAVPRLSEKSTKLESLNKYVFRIDGKSNKVEIRKQLEKAYGVKIDKINIVTVKSKSRRYGRTSGKVSGFKKAIVSLKPNSKKIEIAEAV